MPRKFRLTWQPGSNGREGRWRKKYRGKVYYFAGGSGKYDRPAYEAALSAWEAARAGLDAASPRPHQLAYEQAIVEWELALAWSNRHGDNAMAATASQKLQVLRERLQSPRLAPLQDKDRFEGQWKLPAVSLPEDLLERTAAALDEGELNLTSLPPLTADRAAELGQRIDGSPQRIAGEVWQDRLQQQQRRAAVHDATLQAQVDEFVRQKQHRIDAGELSAGRGYAIRLHLECFCEWLGRDTAVDEIDGSTLLKYQTYLLSRLKTDGWSRTTAQHYLKTLKAFVRWLWQTEAIPVLPRVLDGSSNALHIAAALPAVVTYTTDEVARLLAVATDRTRLYILLMLNCGMTQKDIADLQIEEVDWCEGRIIRKRSKTSQFANVPVVSYLLWKETFRLLQQERNPAASGRVLTNLNGSPICTEQLTTNGKYRKNDNVKNAFDRTRAKVGIRKSLKSFKKTSASMLRNEERFQSLEDLFLGHAPHRMSDRHYTEVPAALLDRAILWLESCFTFPAPPKTARPAR